MADQRYISYLRVSTQRQGRSGLGLEAQRKDIDTFITVNRGRILNEVIEVESGKDNDRPKLSEALAACRRKKATLLIAKIDRLSRNVAFIANLMDSKVEFRACDFPNANRLTVHILAAVAEHERKMISDRTKAALAAAKARGVVLGSPANLTKKAAKRGRLMGTAARTEQANAFAERYRGIIQGHQAHGLSLHGIARALNADEERTARGKEWTAATVRSVIARFA